MALAVADMTWAHGQRSLAMMVTCRRNSQSASSSPRNQADLVVVVAAPGQKEPAVAVADMVEQPKKAADPPMKVADPPTAFAAETPTAVVVVVLRVHAPVAVDAAVVEAAEGGTERSNRRWSDVARTMSLRLVSRGDERYSRCSTLPDHLTRPLKAYEQEGEVSAPAERQEGPRLWSNGVADTGDAERWGSAAS